LEVVIGGSSGGGSSSGTIDYPSYMKSRHEQYLTELRNYLPATNPFVGANAPSIDRLYNNDAITLLDSHITSRVNEIKNWSINPSINVDLQLEDLLTKITSSMAIITEYLSTTHDITLSPNFGNYVTSLIARNNEIDNLSNLENVGDFETVVRPRFLAGMRDVNAVQSSSFVIGLAVLEGVYLGKLTEFKQGLKNDISKIQADVNTQLANFELTVKKANSDRIQNILTLVNQLLSIEQVTTSNLDSLKVQIASSLEQLKIEIWKLRETSLGQIDQLKDTRTGKAIELSRMQIVAAFEQSNVNVDYDEKQFRWDLENYQYLANMLAAIGGGTASAGGRQTSKFSSALGGALSGAAAGAAISGGNPIGAAIGGVIGLGSALLQ